MQQERARGRLKLDRSQQMLHSLLQPAGARLRLAPRADPATLIVQEYVASLDVSLDERAQCSPRPSASPTSHTSLDCLVFGRTVLRAARFVALSNAAQAHPTLVIQAPAALLRLPCIPLWLTRINTVWAIHAQALRVEIPLETGAAFLPHHRSLLASGLAAVQVIDGVRVVGDSSPGEPGSARAQYCSAGQAPCPRSATSPARRTKSVAVFTSLMTGVDSRTDLDRAVATGMALAEGSMFALPAAVTRTLQQVNAEKTCAASPMHGNFFARDPRTHHGQRSGS